ncbi:MAG: acyltransferase [Acetobacteraceae bacterium]|nr:acyltransferase [Acetobacteraceae bacterium]
MAPVSRRDMQSDAIEIARVLLVVGLVCLHYFSFPNETTPPTDGFDPLHHPLATFVNSFVQFFFFSSVPLLSTISGWLFFTAPTPATTFRRMRGKVRSLLLPLISWNALYVAIAFLWFTVQPDSPILKEIGGVDLQQPHASNLVNAVFGVTRLPIGVQFWFIHDLFLSTMVSPVLLLALRRAPVIVGLGLAAVWLSGWDLVIFFRTDVLLFFYLGGLLRRYGVDRPTVGWTTTKIILVCYLAMIGLRTAAPLVADPAPWLEVATKLMRFVGVIVCWGLCLRFAKARFGPRLARYGGFAFFLHAIHYPLIVVVKLLLWDAIPAETDGWMIAQYFATICTTTLLAVLAGWGLFRVAPGVYAFLAGGRVFYQSAPRASKPPLPTEGLPIS